MRINIHKNEKNSASWPTVSVNTRNWSWVSDNDDVAHHMKPTSILNYAVYILRFSSPEPKTRVSLIITICLLSVIGLNFIFSSSPKLGQFQSNLTHPLVKGSHLHTFAWNMRKCEVEKERKCDGEEAVWQSLPRLHAIAILTFHSIILAYKCCTKGLFSLSQNSEFFIPTSKLLFSLVFCLF